MCLHCRVMNHAYYIWITMLQTPEADVISSPGFIAPELHSNPELEQIVVLTFTGNAFMKSSANFLGMFDFSYNHMTIIVLSLHLVLCLSLLRGLSPAVKFNTSFHLKLNCYY